VVGYLQDLDDEHERPKGDDDVDAEGCSAEESDRGSAGGSGWERLRGFATPVAENQLVPDVKRAVKAMSAPTIAEAVQELDRLEADAMLQGAFTCQRQAKPVTQSKFRRCADRPQRVATSCPCIYTVAPVND
jgi:hypothetical protein